MQHRRASDQSALVEHRRRGGGAATAEGHSSFMAQVKMRLKKEKPNGHNHHNNNSQTPTSFPSSTAPPLRFVPHRPYSCDVETLADAVSSHHPYFYNHQATSIRQNQQKSTAAPLLASLGSRKMNSSYQQLTSVVDDDENEELAHAKTPKPPMAAEEDFALESSISCSPDERSEPTSREVKETTIGYINFATQRQSDDHLLKPAPRRALDGHRSAPSTRNSSTSGGELSDKLEKAPWTNARVFLSGQNECGQGRSNYSNRSSTNEAGVGQLQRSQPPPQQQQHKRANNADGPPTEQGSSLIDRIQHQFASARGGAPAPHQQPYTGSGSSTSVLPHELKQEAGALRHAKCQNVVVSVTSFDDDLTAVSSFSSSYHAGDRHQYQRSSSTRSAEPQVRSIRFVLAGDRDTSCS